jgi:hypothetical protein
MKMDGRKYALMGFVVAEFSLCGLIFAEWGWKALGVCIVLCVTVGIRREVEKLK